MLAFWRAVRIGFAGAMKCQATLCSRCHANIAFDVNSVPLSKQSILVCPPRDQRG